MSFFLCPYYLSWIVFEKLFRQIFLKIQGIVPHTKKILSKEMINYSIYFNLVFGMCFETHTIHVIEIIPTSTEAAAGLFVVFFHHYDSHYKIILKDSPNRPNKKINQVKSWH